ncbi:MAG TPA: TonB-dependent receptor, partial [Dongiaceae bacterium]|nr:TonB-dependent receptor [Dongiaceae bacterium]
SDFTYFLEDSVHGDQFEQADQRVFYGLRASHTWKTRWSGREMSSTAGVQTRRDDIGSVGLYHTQAQVRLATVRADQVAQTSGAPYVESTVQWSPWLRSTAGLRGDAYWFHVRSNNPLNSGSAHSAIVSPKLGLSFGPWARTAYFVNAGTGFHSNDARGATITVDPSTLEPVQRVKPLVRATGGEVGIVSRAIPNTEASLSLWLLDLESELVFTGDAGTTEASRPSRRTGAELTLVRPIARALRLDADLAYSRARFTDFDPVGDRIPGAVEGVISAGATVPQWHDWFGSVRVRYFGPRPLIEDNGVRSRASTTLNAELGHALGRWGRLSLDGFNLLDARVSDIDYDYASRLPGEPADGVNDIHTHPQAPRTLRLRLSASWARSGADLPPQTGHPREGDEHH